MKKIWGAMVLISLSFGVMSFLLPVYSQQANMNGVQIGGLFSIFSLVVLLVRPLIGKWLDKVGYKPVLIVGMLLYAVCFVIFACMENGISLYLGRICEAVGAAMVGISSYRIATSQGQQTGVGSEMGRLTTCATWGSFIGLTLYFWSGLSWKGLFILFAIGAVLGSLLVATTRNSGVKTFHTKPSPARESLSQAARRLVGINFILAMTASMLGPILIIYLQDKLTLHINWICMIFLPAALISATLPRRLGAVSDKYERGVVMLVGFGVCIIAILLIPITQSIVWIALLWGLHEVGELLYGPAKQALFYELSGEHEAGYKYGIYQTVQGVGTIVGPILGGMLYDRNLSQWVFYSVAAGLIGAAILSYIYFVKKSDDQVYVDS